MNVKTEITCITCPLGCRIRIETENGEHVFHGSKCQRGKEFAQAEITFPVRSLTTTVRTIFPDMPVLPVRTNGEIPKGKITEIIRELANVTITEKIGIGETIVADVLGTGCDIVATRDMGNVK